MVDKEENEIFRISVTNNLKSSTLIIGLLTVFTALNLYGYFYHPYYNLNAFLYTIVLILPGLGPAILVHLEYVMCNWKTTLEVNKTTKKLLYKDKGKEIEASFDDIAYIIKHQVKDTALLYGFYKYYEIHLECGEVLVITNLMVRDFSIPGIEIEIIERYFPSVWWYNNVSSQ
jgi:hypothetical protein